MQIKNNNIRCINPNTGKVTYTHKHWFLHFIDLINSTYCEEVIKIGDKLYPFKVWSLNSFRSSQKSEFCDILETGTELTINGWKFKTV